jgi:hypothetical protein
MDKAYQKTESTQVVTNSMSFLQLGSALQSRVALLWPIYHMKIDFHPCKSLYILVQVTVQAGCRVQQVADALKPYGLTLQNYASIRDQQIGGFVQVCLIFCYSFCSHDHSFIDSCESLHHNWGSLKCMGDMNAWETRGAEGAICANQGHATHKGQPKEWGMPIIFWFSALMHVSAPAALRPSCHALKTGAHGTGATLPPVDDQVVAMRLVTPAMGVITLSK